MYDCLVDATYVHNRQKLWNDSMIAMKAADCYMQRPLLCKANTFVDTSEQSPKLAWPLAPTQILVSASQRRSRTLASVPSLSSLYNNRGRCKIYIRVRFLVAFGSATPLLPPQISRLARVPTIFPISEDYSMKDMNYNSSAVERVSKI